MKLYELVESGIISKFANLHLIYGGCDEFFNIKAKSLIGTEFYIDKANKEIAFINPEHDGFKGESYLTIYLI